MFPMDASDWVKCLVDKTAAKALTRTDAAGAEGAAGWDKDAFFDVVGEGAE